MNNMFTDIIYDKMMADTIYKKFKSWVSYKKFMRILNKVSPDIDMMWQFSDFMKTLEITSWYDNSKANMIFSSKDYKDGENGFVIVKTDPRMQIIFKLYSETDNIAMSVKREYGNKRNSEIIFKNRELELTSKEDEMLMLNVIRTVTDTMRSLLKSYYERA